MQNDRLLKVINDHLNQAWEDLDNAQDHEEQNYASGWVDCCNTILKAMGQPTPTDLDAVKAQFEGAYKLKH